MRHSINESMDICILLTHKPLAAKIFFPSRKSQSWKLSPIRISRWISFSTVLDFKIGFVSPSRRSKQWEENRRKTTCRVLNRLLFEKDNDNSIECWLPAISSIMQTNRIPFSTCHRSIKILNRQTKHTHIIRFCKIIFVVRLSSTLLTILQLH